MVLELFVDDIEIQLLGNFSLRQNQIPLANFSDRQQSLLAYLLLHSEQPQSRQTIAFHFWPTSSDQQAKTNLRQLLHHLRQSWPEIDRNIQITPRTVQWTADNSIKVDTAVFQTLIRRADSEASLVEKGRLLEEAARCYRGDLLPGCYDDWILPIREQFRRQFISAQEKVVQLNESQGQYQPTVHWAEQLLESDPLNEETYRTLMRLHTLANNRAAALRVYHTCETVLHEELGVEPSPATREQYRRLLNINTSVEQPAAVLQIPQTSPLIGRNQEWAILDETWKSVQGGQAKVVLIHGEAGIGKTRLLEEFQKWAILRGAVMAEARSYSAEGQLTYAPLTTWLRSENIRRRLTLLDEVWLAEVSRLLPELLLENPHLVPPQPFTESWQRQRFYEALALAVLKGADTHPLVLTLDDLQWSSPGMLDWLSFLLQFAAHRPLLLMGTIRSGTIDAVHPLQLWAATLRQDQRLTEIRLHPLGKNDSALLANHIAGHELPPDRLENLYRETEGNPFFLVETIRAALENPGSISEVSQLVRTPSFPPKVQAVLESRLSQLSAAARDLADYAAVIGREFSFDVLAQTIERDEEALVNSLDELWQRRIIREQGKTAYDFSHDKIREGVYIQISQARRRLLHRRVAEAMQIVYSGNLSSVSAQLATHYEQAQIPQEAISFYQKAAEDARQVYANAEVVRLLTQAIDLLESLPEGESRDKLELDLRVALSAPLVALSGYNNPAVIVEYRQVIGLCGSLKQPPDPRALRGLAIANILQADFQQSSSYGQQIIDLTQNDQDPVLLVEGHYVLGVSAFWRGQFEAARVHLEMALAHYSPERNATHISAYAQDPGIICQTRLAWTLWHLGYPDQAYRMMAQAVKPQNGSPHPFSVAYARAFACMLYEDAEDEHRLREQTEKLGTLTAESNFFYLQTWAAFHQGWIVGLNGDYAGSAGQIRQVIDQWHSEETYLLTPRMLERLAVAYWRSDCLEEGAATLEEAWKAAVQRDETYFLAELARMKGALLLVNGGKTGETAVFYQEAISIARRQGAKMLELRALVSLCHLWQGADSANQLRDAQHQLQTSYDWFTEGFDSADLQAAKILLNALS